MHILIGKNFSCMVQCFFFFFFFYMSRSVGAQGWGFVGPYTCYMVILLTLQLIVNMFTPKEAYPGEQKLHKTPVKMRKTVVGPLEPPLSLRCYIENCKKYYFYSFCRKVLKTLKNIQYLKHYVRIKVVFHAAFCCLRVCLFVCLFVLICCFKCFHCTWFIIIVCKIMFMLFAVNE